MTVRKWFITELHERKKKRHELISRLLFTTSFCLQLLDFLNRIDRDAIHVIILVII